MTGIVSTAPPANAVGALLGGPALAAPSLAIPGVSIEPGSAPFLNLLWLFGGDAPIDNPVAEEPGQSESAPTDIEPSVVVAAPQLIAGALIRSMLNTSALSTRQNAGSTQPVQMDPISISEPAPLYPSEPVLPVEKAMPIEESDREVTPIDSPEPEKTVEVPPVPESGALPTVPVPSSLPFVPAVPTAPLPPVQPAQHEDSAEPYALPMAAAPVATPAFTESPAPEKVARSPLPTAPSAEPPSSGKLTLPPAPRLATERPSPLVFALRLTAHEEPATQPIPAATAPAIASTAETRTSPLLPSPPLLQEVGLPISRENCPPAPPLSPRPATQESAVPLVAATSAEEKSAGEGADSQQPESKPQQPIPSKSERESAPKLAPPRTESAPVPPVASSISTGASAVQITAPHGLAQRPSPNPVVSAAPDTAAPFQAKEPTPSPEVRTGSTHAIAVRISAPDAVPVDLHIAERGGEVRVAVRTADAELQTSLRQDLGTLVDRLEHSGFHAETLVPHQTSSSTRIENTQSFDLSSSFRAHAVTDTASTTANHDSSQDSDSSGRQQNQADSGARQQQQQRRQNSARHSEWMEAMIEPTREDQTYDD